MTEEHIGRLKMLSRIWGKVLKLSQCKTCACKDHICDRNPSFLCPGAPLSCLGEMDLLCRYLFLWEFGGVRSLFLTWGSPATLHTLRSNLQASVCVLMAQQSWVNTATPLLVCALGAGGEGGGLHLACGSLHQVTAQQGICLSSPRKTQ